MALYRAGDYKASVPVLEKASQLASDRPGAGRFHLAMAYGQLGEKDLARRWYDQAITFVEKYEMWWSENRRIRADAAKVLGLPKADKP